jgi:DNA-binding response OmpR family regulator
MSSTDGPVLVIPGNHSVDRAIDLVSRHFLHYFGAAGASEQPVVSALAAMMVVQDARLRRLEERVYEQATPQVQEAQQPPRITADRPVIDREAFTMVWNTKTYTFHDTIEFAILAHLAWNFGAWVPVRRLLSEVWGDRIVEKNTVSRTISNLRKNLKLQGITDLEIDGKNRNHYMLRRTD